MKEEKVSENFEDLKGHFSINYAETTAAPRKNLHIHSAYEVTLILSDGVTLDVNNESYPVPYGSLLIFNTMDLHRISFNGSGSYKRWVIWFKHEFLGEFGQIFYSMLRCFFARGFERSHMLTLSDDQLSVFFDICARLKSASSDSGYMVGELTKLILGEMLIHVNKWYLTKNSLYIASAPSSYAHVYDAILFVQNNFSDKTDRKALAKLTGVDERTLCNDFKAITGQTTAQYILSVRINSAKAYLINGMSVTEVCEKTGFENWSNFSRTFKNHVGVSPKQYAMQNRHFQTEV